MPLLFIATDFPAAIAPEAVAVISGAAEIVVQLAAEPVPPEVNTCPLVP